MKKKDSTLLSQDYLILKNKYDSSFYQQRQLQIKDRLAGTKFEFEKQIENLKCIQDLVMELKNDLLDQQLMGDLQFNEKQQKKHSSITQISEEKQQFLNLVHHPQTQRQKIPKSTNIRLVLNGKVIGYECGICNQKQYQNVQKLAGHIKQALNHRANKNLDANYNTMSTLNLSSDDFANYEEDSSILKYPSKNNQIDSLITDKFITSADDFPIQQNLNNVNQQIQDFQFYLEN